MTLLTRRSSDGRARDEAPGRSVRPGVSGRALLRVRLELGDPRRAGELVISSVTFFSEVAEKVMTPAPLPDSRTAPVSPLSTRQAPIRPTAPEASRTLIFETDFADHHLTEMLPVEPLGDQ